MIKKRILFAGVFLASALAMPLFAAETAKSVYELERSKAMDPAKMQLRGDSADPQKYNYKVGEEITFLLRFDCGQKGDLNGWTIAVDRFGEDGVKESASFPAESGKNITFKTKGKAPGFVLVRATLKNEKGKVVMNGRRPLCYMGGMGVEIEKIKADPYPEDFDAYWDKVVQEVKSAKMNVNLTPVQQNANPAVKLYIFRIPCGKDMESTGYISIPAKPGKYPALVKFSGYGNVSSIARPKLDPKTIMVTVSRFGIMPGKDKKFYAEAGKKLQGYGFRNNSSRESCYFKGMVIRDLTALKFVKSRPEWNGKNLKVSGGSMGGLQTMWMAGLDKDVTEAFAMFPWCCDLQAQELKRAKSTFAPKFTPELRYFDAVNFAHRIPAGCKVAVSTGIGDPVCPISGVFRAYMSIPGPKSIDLKQGATHAACHRNPQVYRIKGNPVPAK